MNRIKSSNGMRFLTLVAFFSMALNFAGCMRRKHQTQVYSSLEEAQGFGKSSRSLASDTAAVEDAPSLEKLPDLDQVSDRAAASLASAADNHSGESLTAGQEFGRYTVKSGDTLMKIAFQIYGDIDRWKEIYRLNKNKLHSRSQLTTGQNLAYAAPTSTPQTQGEGEPYLIKNGDTLGSISYDIYGMTKQWRELYERNRNLIKNPNRIFSGFYLYYQITEQQKAQAAVLKKNGKHFASRKNTAPPTQAPAYGSEAGSFESMDANAAGPSVGLSAQGHREGEPSMGPPLPPTRSPASR